MLALGRTGPTGTWTALAAGEVLSAGIALVVLRRLDVPATRGSAPADGDPDGRGHAAVAVRDLPDRQ